MYVYLFIFALSESIIAKLAKDGHGHTRNAGESSI